MIDKLIDTIVGYSEMMFEKDYWVYILIGLIILIIYIIFKGF